ncbi:MAG: hypothetical protein GWN53_17155 [Gammaproteobacteria bacterium]|uniref:Uncharacterized protein n=1 Tax=Candidatus Kutchimonas denitrificans TaxID=3056748 RepID=A0AAE5CD06_9BACT|nr:hypothetical protein [Candidatus Kutchimonas denitrificans]NIV53570.1 hypothetical protein [Gammaproteobacteria bacterium]
MPYLKEPEPRHYGRLGSTIKYSRQGLRFEEAVGVLYDPQQIPPAELDRKWDELQEQKLTELDEIIERVDMTPETAARLVYQKAWDIALTIRAEWPEHVIPDPGLNHPEPRDERGWWYPSEDERGRIEDRRERREKGMYIAETGDWAVDGEGV